MSYMLSLSEQTKLNAFLSGILDDYKTGVITQIQAVGRIGNVFSALESGDSKKVVTNGAIVIHTQRLKSDPGGNLLS